jgi:hypothetical protein
MKVAHKGPQFCKETGFKPVTMLTAYLVHFQIYLPLPFHYWPFAQVNPFTAKVAIMRLLGSVD